MSFSFTSVQTLKCRHISSRYGLHLPAFFNCHTPIIECSNISITDPSLIFFLTCSLYYVFCALGYLIYMQQISSPNRPVVARGVQRISELVALTFSQPMRKKFFLALQLIFDFFRRINNWILTKLERNHPEETGTISSLTCGVQVVRGWGRG